MAFSTIALSGWAAESPEADPVHCDAGKSVEEVRPIRDEIDARVRALLDELAAPAEAETPAR